MVGTCWIKGYRCWVSPYRLWSFHEGKQSSRQLSTTFKRWSFCWILICVWPAKQVWIVSRWSGRLEQVSFVTFRVRGLIGTYWKGMCKVAWDRPDINGNFRILKWRYCTIYCKAIFCGDIPLHRPYAGLIYGRYLQFRFLKWPLMIQCYRYISSFLIIFGYGKRVWKRYGKDMDQNHIPYKCLDHGYEGRVGPGYGPGPYSFSRGHIGMVRDKKVQTIPTLETTGNQTN